MSTYDRSAVGGGEELLGFDHLQTTKSRKAVRGVTTQEMNVDMWIERSLANSQNLTNPCSLISSSLDHQKGNTFILFSKVILFQQSGHKSVLYLNLSLF